ncbi:MAG: AsnC family protein [Aigarchaeota archaeon]|nr:AsnC family protein [Candidatus Pelearchaeum maunauluense]
MNEVKLGSTPTEEAVARVVAAAMKWGPTKVARIATECGIPTETCRHYIKTLFKKGYTFTAVVDYHALGLQQCMALLRLSREWRRGLRENNLVRWLERIYAVYRAGLAQGGEYLFHVAVPQGEEREYVKLLEDLVEKEVIERYEFYMVKDGYYAPRWIKMYSLLRDAWRSTPLETEIQKTPITYNNGTTDVDKLDLAIILRLEIDPRKHNREIAKETGYSAQLISYHRQKHVEGQRLITGFVAELTRESHERKLLIIATKREELIDEALLNYMHLRIETPDSYVIYRLHLPFQLHTKLTPDIQSLLLHHDKIIRFGIPLEHYNADGEWTSIRLFLQNVDEVVATIRRE